MISYEKLLAAVYFEGASGRGCVMPVRRKPSSAARYAHKNELSGREYPLLCSEKRISRSELFRALREAPDIFPDACVIIFKPGLCSEKQKCRAEFFCRYTQRNENASIRFLPLCS